MVGLSSKTDEKVRDIVMREAELYRDIVVTSLEDSYTKLAFKVDFLFFFLQISLTLKFRPFQFFSTLYQKCHLLN